MTLDIDCLADETETFDFDLLGALSPELEHHTEGTYQIASCYVFC